MQPVTTGQGPQMMPDARTQATVTSQSLFFRWIFISSSLKLLHSTNIHDQDSQDYQPETKA